MAISTIVKTGSPIAAVTFCRLECDHKELFQVEYKRCVRAQLVGLFALHLLVNLVCSYHMRMCLCVCLFLQEQPHKRSQDPSVREHLLFFPCACLQLVACSTNKLTCLCTCAVVSRTAVPTTWTAVTAAARSTYSSRPQRPSSLRPQIPTTLASASSQCSHASSPRPIPGWSRVSASLSTA